MAKAYFPEFFARWKRFFFLKEGDEALSEEVVNVQPVIAQLAAQGGDESEPILVPLETASNASPVLRVALYDAGNLAVTTDTSGDADATISRKLNANVYNYGFNGFSFDRIRVPDDIEASAGATALTILAAGGTDVFHRIFTIDISSDTGGLVVLSDGLPSVYLPANGVHRFYFPQGWRQNTANTAITATLAASTLAASVTFNGEN